MTPIHQSNMTKQKFSKSPYQQTNDKIVKQFCHASCPIEGLRSIQEIFFLLIKSYMHRWKGALAFFKDSSL